MCIINVMLTLFGTHKL